MKKKQRQTATNELVTLARAALTFAERQQIAICEQLVTNLRAGVPTPDADLVQLLEVFRSVRPKMATTRAMLEAQIKEFS